MDRAVRVLLADDHPLVRAGIRATLLAESDLTLVGEAADGYEVRRLCLEQRPDVVLLDLSMPGPIAMETAAYLRHHCPETRILVLTAYDKDVYVRGMMRAGALGYILKDEAPKVVVQAIRAVVRGDQWFSQKILIRLGQPESENSVQVGGTQLTEREVQVLGMLAQGWDNAQIAQSLSLAGQTVRNHLHSIYCKLNVKSRGEAIVWARERGMVEPDRKAGPPPGG